MKQNANFQNARSQYSQLWKELTSKIDELDYAQVVIIAEKIKEIENSLRKEVSFYDLLRLD